jgi:hypothetical protein
MSRLHNHSAGRLDLRIPLFRAPAACWCARATVESTLTSHVINPNPSARVCNRVRIRAQVPSRCQRRNKPYTVCQGPYRSGTSRHGDPVRTRHRIPLINCRFGCFGGRPGFFPFGSNASNTVHCSSVRSARPPTGKVIYEVSVVMIILVDDSHSGDLVIYPATTRQYHHLVINIGGHPDKLSKHALGGRNIELRLTRVHHDVRTMLDRTGLLHALGADHVHQTTGEGIDRSGEPSARSNE